MTYWEEFYKKFNLQEPSPFAQMAVKYLRKSDVVADMGSGNGRDTYFLANHCKEVVGIDPSNLPDNHNNATFRQHSVFDMTFDKYDVFYGRFFMHALTEEEEDQLLELLSGTIILEFRSDKGRVPDNTHYRRLINSWNFFAKLFANEFEILYFEEGRGLAKYGQEDPYIIRIIAKKKI